MKRERPCYTAEEATILNAQIHEGLIYGLTVNKGVPHGHKQQVIPGQFTRLPLARRAAQRLADKLGKKVHLWKQQATGMNRQWLYVQTFEKEGVPDEYQS
jgi:hypothetical protein